MIFLDLLKSREGYYLTYLIKIYSNFLSKRFLFFEQKENSKDKEIKQNFGVFKEFSLNLKSESLQNSSNTSLDLEDKVI